MTNEIQTTTVYEINAAGMAALTAWLEERLSDPSYAEVFARHLIFEADFSPHSWPQVELRAFYAKDHHAHVYHFSRGEYDLVTYDDDDNVVERETTT